MAADPDYGSDYDADLVHVLALHVPSHGVVADYQGRYPVRLLCKGSK